MKRMIYYHYRAVLTTIVQKQKTVIHKITSWLQQNAALIIYACLGPNMAVPTLILVLPTDICNNNNNNNNTILKQVYLYKDHLKGVVL